MENQGLKHDVWGDLNFGFGVHSFGSYGSRSGSDSVACFVDVDEYLVAVAFCSFFPAVEVGWESTRLKRGFWRGGGLGRGGEWVVVEAVLVVVLEGGSGEVGGG